jgi:rRNA biogenesis protein RRP5
MADAAQPRKRHRRQQKDSEDGAHTPVAAAAQPSSDAPQDFPRGRAAAPAAPAPGTASASASGSGDFLFGTARPSGAGGRKTKAKRARSAASQKTSRAVAQSSGDGLEAVAERGMMVPKKVHLLTYKRLSVGMSMLGQVVEVKETGITLGLPDNLTGHVSFMDLSDRHHASDDIDDAEDSGATPVSQLVQVGDLLRCSVVNLRRTHGHSHVDASLRPSLLNAALSAKSLVPGLGVAGTVDSVEDHGYTVDLGIDGTSGFLPFEDASSKDWPIGRPVECVVQQSKKRKASKRVVHLTALAAEVNSAKVRDFPGLSLSTLQAGMLVSAQVASVVSTGAVLTFLRHFVGVVDMFHLRDGAASSGGESISPNDKVSARILYVDPVNKTIGLTLKPRLARNEGLDLSSSVPVGSTFEDALVKRVDPVLGICLELPGQPDCTGFAHLSRISDEHIDKIGKEYTVGTRHTCRVVGHSPMDCVANVSLQDSTLSAPFLRIEDIEVGAAVSGTVLSVESYGIIVTLADRIRGLCPCVHLGELEVKKPHSKFKPGAAVRCHVLSVDVANSRVILTMKKSLCTSQLPRITTFSDANVGSVYEGYISAIKEAGCIVSFFNGVHGLAPKSKLGVSGINSGELQPDDCFRVGQTLKVKVLSCSPEQGKMLLTPDLSAVPAEGKIRCQDLVGKTVAGIVTKKAANKLEFQLDVDGLAEGTIGTIDEQHVSDHAEFCTEVLQTFEVGQKVNQMLVLKASGLNKRITLTLKPCLLAAAVSEAIPSSIDALVVGVTYPGYVSNVTDFGVFVRFGSSLTGLAMRGNVADEFVSDPAQHFSVGQSVQARVLKVDSSTKKFELSLKQSHCKAATDSFLRSYFADVCTIAGVSRRRSAFGWYSALKIGGTVEGVVEDMRYGGVIIDLGNDLTGFVKEEHCPDSTPCTVGDKVKARVLDADPRKAIVDLSLLPELLKQASKKRSVKAGSALRGTVQLVKSDYAVLTLDKSGIVCLANCKDYNARSINSQSLYKYGSSLTVQITSKTGTKSTDSPHATVPLATIMTESVTQSRKRQKKFDLQNDLSSLADVRVGMRTTGQIHKIHKNHMSVILGPKIPGRVHITEAVNEEHAKNGQNVFGDYQVGQQVTTRVLAVVTDHGQTYVDLSLRASTLQSDEIQHRASLQSLSRGQTFLAPIQKVQADALWVCLSQAVKGRVAAVDAVESVSKGQSMLDLFQAGSLLRCRVMEVNTDKKTVDLSAVDSSKLSPGCKCVGIVTKIRDGDAMYVRLPGLRHGRVHITDVHDVGVEYPFQNYRLGQLLECAVVAVNTEKDQLDLSVKSSHLSGSGDSAAIEVKDFKQGQRVHGYVRSISKQGCFVNLTRSLVGRVILRELSDSFVADLTGQFPVGKLVSATVTNVSLDSGKVDLSLKSSAGGNGSDKYSFDSLEVGQKYRCTVRRIESFGASFCVLHQLSDDGHNSVRVY